ncbi:glycosyltransferase family 39 protein [Hydrogenophilus thiooxidans]|uniref:glycosyltransferase family 39 protein n=1 Tax=Hydrogenophilus thiooxidans TaxID=2820326 RepID=UPI001C245F67|nr:glycosyltransferase family 39 protein [Hydrogenophilus thiooxidans]
MDALGNVLRRGGACLLLCQRFAPIQIARFVLWVVAFAFIAEGYDRHTPSNDEWVQHTYGELLWDFWLSGATDKTFLSFSNLYLYGGLFDLIAAAGTRAFGWEWWPWRHLLTATFGLLALWGTARLARLVAGTTGEGVALALTLLTGPFWGAIFTHTKDIPFAAAMVWALYYTVRVAEQPTRLRRRHLLLWGVATGIALGIRVGAVLIPFFLAAGFVMNTLWPRPAPDTPRASDVLSGTPSWGTRLRSLARRIPHWLWSLLPGCAVALAITAFAWPWSVMGWDHLWLALTKFSHFAFDIYTWEDGERLRNSQVSPFYLLHYLLVRLPEGVWLGLLLWLLFRFGRREGLGFPAERQARLRLVVFAAVFVLTFVTASHPPLYNGIRHFLFLVPWLIALSSAGWTALGEALGKAQGARRTLMAGVALVGGANLLWVAWVNATLHPYEHVYYNTLAGDLEKADIAWETDYWSDATRALLPAIRAWLAQQPPGTVANLAYCAEGFQIEPWLPENVVVVNDWEDADLYLSTTHDNCHYVLDGETIATVSRRGVALAVLKDVRDSRPPDAQIP